MRTDIPMYLRALVLIFVLASPACLHADNHNPVLNETPDRAVASQVHVPSVQLGRDADAAATVEWRTRRVYTRARELSKRGIQVDRDRLDDWVVVGAVGMDEPNAEYFMAEVKGTPTTTMLSVGMLLGGKSEATAYSRCTVTLTRPDTILTARHCLSHTHGDSFWVYLPYGGVRSIPAAGISFYCKDGDTDCSVTADDLAIATLDAPYTFLMPARPGEASTAANGQKAKIVGYGLNSPDLADYGIKRQGQIVLASCTMASTDGPSLCFAHPLDQTTGSSIYAACNNDSGGPMLTPAMVWQRVIGVASQLIGTCDGAGEGRYVNVTDARYQEWLENAYCDPECTGDSGLVLTELVQEPSGYLDVSETEEVFPLTVPAGASSLIVTLNHGRGWYPDTNDFDLEITAALNPSCVKFVEAEVCEVTEPAAGSYTATVKRVRGEADYQLSAVALSAAEEPDSE